MDRDNTAQDSKDEFVCKKIFFLYPHASVLNQIITELNKNEFEVYIAKDHTRLAQVLRKYKESIIFINLDDKMPVPEWERWISASLATEPTIKIGVFTSNNDEEFRDKFIKNNSIKCGLLNIKHDLSKTTEVILEMMNVMNVKGRRKFLRISPDRDTIATISIPSGGNFIKGVIKDISVVGFSCVFEGEPNLKKSALIKDIQIKLQSMLLNVEAVVFGSRDHEQDNHSERIYVMLFTHRIDTETRSGKIRSYIQKNLQSRMDAEIN